MKFDLLSFALGTIAAAIYVWIMLAVIVWLN